LYVLRSVPPSLKAALQVEQFQILRTQVPILYAALSINTCILAFSIHGLVPAFLSLSVPAIFLALIAVRVFTWLVWRRAAPKPARISRYLAGTTMVAALVAAGLGIWSIALLESGVGDKPFVPLFIALGSVACAFCLASLPKAAFATILCATAPVTFWLLSGDRLQVTTGLNLLLIFALILRLIIHQYHYLLDKVETHSQVLALAYADPLTKLPNRTVFTEQLDLALQQAGLAGGQVGLVVLDVDHFKTVNDALGHAAGDALLKEIAARLAATVPAGGIAARLGGDEFAIILPGLRPEDATVETIRAVLFGLDAPMLVEGRIIDASVSAGAAFWPQDGQCPVDLLKSADLALYAAKADGRGEARVFQSAMRQGVERRKTMLHDAREALRDDRILPFYQPKVRLITGEVVGFEALLRWQHPTNGLQPPYAIHAALEDNELAAQITDRMMDAVFADMRDWLQADVTFGKIAMNGSPADFLRRDFADRLLGRLDRFGIPAERVELEVTESVFFGQLAESVEQTLNRLSDAGVTIALDDFGTGYASLSHLKQFPVDVIKIDRSFVSRLTDNDEEEDAAIVGAVLNLAQNLRITTVAEGIETQAQAAYLRRKGCDLGQGFLFSRAVPAVRVPQMTKQRYLRQMGQRYLGIAAP